MPSDIEVGLLQRQPSNLNFLSPVGFRFLIKKIPTVNYFVQQARIPAITLSLAPIDTPFKVISFPGTKLTYGDFSIDFRIDEDMRNYLEIRDWIKLIGFPESYDQYKKIDRDGKAVPGEGIYSDGTLMILSSAMNPNIEVSLTNMFPIGLSDIVMMSTDTTIAYPSATATFKYSEMYFRHITKSSS